VPHPAPVVFLIRAAASGSKLENVTLIITPAAKPRETAKIFSFFPFTKKTINAPISVAKPAIADKNSARKTSLVNIDILSLPI